MTCRKPWTNTPDEAPAISSSTHPWLQIILSLILALCFLPILAGTSSAGEDVRGSCVILLHGLARSSTSMSTMAERLADKGYLVSNSDYPSRHHAIEELADIAVNQGLAYCRKNKTERIHFVTHSLGGILVRYYLAHHEIEELGRVVMLAPPNQGSKVVDEFSGMPGYRWLNGPAGLQLGTDADSIPLRLGPARFEVGIIAGDRTINLILSTAFDGPNDGKVAVEDAKLEGMTDFIIVHRTHPFIMQGGEVIEQVLYFLENGHFKGNESRISR